MAQMGPVIYTGGRGSTFPVVVPQQPPENALLRQMMNDSRGREGTQELVTLMMALMQMSQSEQSRSMSERQFNAEQALTRELASAAQTREERRSTADEEYRRELFGEQKRRSQFEEGVTTKMQGLAADNEKFRLDVMKEMADQAKWQSAGTRATERVSRDIGREIETTKGDIGVSAAESAIQEAKSAQRSELKAVPAIDDWTRALEYYKSSGGGANVFSKSRAFHSEALDKGLFDTTQSLTSYIFQPGIPKEERSRRAEALLPKLDEIAKQHYDAPVPYDPLDAAWSFFGGETSGEKNRRLVKDYMSSVRNRVGQAVLPARLAESELERAKRIRDASSQAGRRAQAAEQTFEDYQLGGAQPLEAERAARRAAQSGTRVPLPPSTQPVTANPEMFTPATQPSDDPWRSLSLEQLLQ